MVERIVVLDSGLIGLLTNPKKSEEGDACSQWVQTLLESGVRVIVPEIADYEVRRELIRARKVAGLHRLDALGQQLEYHRITTDMMRHAAVLWAQVRRAGKPTAHPHALDADAILAAQAMAFGENAAVIATTNVKHLTRFTAAKTWREFE